MENKKLKVLVIRFSSIGDIVLTSPVIRCLKEQIKDLELHYLTKKSFEQVLSANPYIDKLHFLGDSLQNCVSDLKKEKFDHIIDLHHNLRTLIIKKSLGVPAKSFDKLNWQKWLLVNFKKNSLPNIHIVDRYLETVEFLGIKNDNKGLNYFLSGEYKIEELLPSTHHKYIALVIGAQHGTKRMPTERIIELAQGIKQAIVLLGGPEDAERGEMITKNVGNHVLNACGRFKLDQSAFLVKMSEKVISHDTGLMHIAAAFKKPILSIWGNTVPEFGMYPYQVDQSFIFEVKNLKCRPCSKIGHKSCPKGHFKCMNDIELKEIIEIANA